MKNVIGNIVRDHLSVIDKLEEREDAITKVCMKIENSIKEGGKVIWMGNGGSAADSQHLAAELVGRFRRNRGALPSLALTTDTSVLTAISNDFGYDTVFERQIEAHCDQYDVVIGISTSGDSENVVKGVIHANNLGAYTVGFTGEHGGSLKGKVNTCIEVPSNSTARIQEAHILLGHIICEWIDKEVKKDEI